MTMYADEHQQPRADQEEHDLEVMLINTDERSEAWRGILTAPLGFSSSASFSSGTADLLNGAQDKINTLSTVLGASSNSAFQKASVDLQGTSVRLHKLTLKHWAGSEDPVINVSFALMNDERTKDAFGEYYDLHAACYARLSDGSFESSDGRTTSRALIAPYGYTATIEGGLSGSWTLQVGNWFRADQLLLTGVTLDPSVTVDESRNTPSPIYAAVTATFTTQRSAYADQVRKWYKARN